MNDVLSFAGVLLYMAINIIIFPLIVMLDCLLGLVVAFRYTKKLKRKLVRSVHRQKAGLYQFLHKRQFAFYKKVAR